MVLERRISVKRAVPVLLIGLAIFVAYLYFFVDIPKMVAVLQQTNFFYYSLAIVALFLDVFFYSMTWQYLLLPLSVKFPFKKTFQFTWVGIFVDLLVPFESVSGDISKIYLMSRESEGNTGRVVASLISQRILFMIITVGSLIIGSLSILILSHGLPAYILNLTILVAITTAASMIFLIIVCFKRQITEKVVDSMIRFFERISRGRWHLASLKSKVQEGINAFYEAIKALRLRPKSLVQPVISSVVGWVFSLLISFFSFVSLGYLIPFGVVVIVYSISCGIQLIPLGIPAEVGVVDVAMAYLYTLFGVPVVISGAATLLIRILTVWVRLLVGFIAFQWVGVKALMGSPATPTTEISSSP